jgi:hypothetical protein
MSDRAARIWFGSTAAVVAAGLVIQVLVVATAGSSHWGSIPARIFNVFCYFTIESNVILGVTCLLLAIRLDRRSQTFATFRLIGVVAIAITGLVYHVAIAHLVEFDGWGLVADQLTHTVAPVAGVAGWVVAGPRGLTSWRTVGLVLLYPLGYITFTLARGPIVHFYPYHFIDVTALGYGKVAANCVWLAGLILAVTAAAHGLDGWLVRQRRGG